MLSFATVEEMLDKMDGISIGQRVIHSVVLHHTWSPDHAQWAGDESAQGILTYWKQSTVQKGWKNHLGGHILIAPAGKIYLPFGDFKEPLNADTNPDANKHGIAIETVGNFDTGHDQLQGAQRHAVTGVIAGLLLRFKLEPERLFFHRSFETYKSCPGTGLDLDSVRAEAGAGMAWVKARAAGKNVPCPCCSPKS